ncbi:MAG: glycosyl hydrolase [Bacteroidales bacterium]|jgi:hypothetical protein|nr:glycosyl hydrolase [Bacteroidales bacterium]
MMNKFLWLVCALAVFSGCRETELFLEKGFQNPPDSARPGVYWYFMDGNLSGAAVTKDLEAMKQAGVGYVVFLEVNVGVPRGNVDFLSEEWLDIFRHAMQECERLGIGVTLGVGPGWTGSGGPWVAAEQSMQHLVFSSVEAEASGTESLVLHLPEPLPKQPFFGEGSLTVEIKRQWDDFYEDVALLAFPAGATRTGAAPEPGDAYLKMTGIEEKALYYRKPYSSVEGVKQYLPAFETYAAQPGDVAVGKDAVIDLTGRLQADGSLEWDAPAGKWTIMRFGRRNNGAITRPAPFPGLGMEVDKFDTAALNMHLDRFIGTLFRHAGFRKANPAGGLQMLHMDSWEMGAQNWTKRFREEFTRRRGYDPLPFYPAYAGVMVQSREESERFLWDLRQTAQELVLENHAGHIKRYGERYGLGLSIEPYDMNPTSDLELAAIADMPMCEFWSIGGYNTSFSTGEGASVAHIKGQPVVPAEAFTAHHDGWRQHPASMKNQGEWAFAAGVNRFMYHTFQHQSLPDNLRPGMTMGPYGVHWDRNQTWWHMAGAYHRYVARCQFMLQQGRTVADILYLCPEGAPHVFRAPASALEGYHPMMPDRKGYNFDGCPPGLLYRATVENNRIVFPGGTSYGVLALPCFKTMTPALLKKITALVKDGATVVGLPPEKSPSLSNYPGCDREVQTLARELWGEEDTPETLAVRPFGKGRIICGKELETNADNLYPHYDLTAGILSETLPEDFASPGQIRYTHRTAGDDDIYFVSNRTDRTADVLCRFRVTGKQPELWHPVTGKMTALPEYEETEGQTAIRLKFDLHEGYFIVFRNKARKPDGNTNFMELECLATLDAPWTVSFDPQWGGPISVVFDSLCDWTSHPDPGIRYYSGTAIYRQSFDMPVSKGNVFRLDLGEVKNMARVRLNGKDLGVVWTSPWQVDVTGVVQPTGNRLEIEVANLWPNRLIGDEQLPYDGVSNGRWPDWLTEGKPRTGGRYAFASYHPYTKDSPLLESGLKGPVRIYEGACR